MKIVETSNPGAVVAKTTDARRRNKFYPIFSMNTPADLWGERNDLYFLILSHLTSAWSTREFMLLGELHHATLTSPHLVSSFPATLPRNRTIFLQFQALVPWADSIFSGSFSDTRNQRQVSINLKITNTSAQKRRDFSTSTSGTRMSGEGTAFVYGTLMAPEVFFSVCYGDENPPKIIRDLHTFTPALLHGFSRRRVKSADYPGAVPEAGHEIRGFLVTGLTDANIDKLDFFEGSEYERRTVIVQELEKVGRESIPGKEVSASVYVFLKVDDLEKREWDFEEFRREKMMFWARRGLGTYDPNDRAIVNAAV
ncbi:hypothetical protein E4U21_001353 [Claviceps maximensis]|nr:hypothetical protein E4U21_001353 [Claviceps maximensis]